MKITQQTLVRIIGGVIVLAALVAGGWYWYQNSQLDRDIAHWEQLAKNHPNGQTYLTEIRTQAAKIRDNDKSNDGIAYVFLAANANVLGDKDGALRYYDKVLRIDPNNRTALNNIAGIYEDKSDWTEAEKYYLELLSKNKTYVDGYRKLAYLYQYRFENSEDQIKKLIDRGLAETNNSPDLLSWIVSYYQEKGMGDKAVPYSQRLVDALNAQKSPSTTPGIDVKVK